MQRVLHVHAIPSMGSNACARALFVQPGLRSSRLSTHHVPTPVRGLCSRNCRCAICSSIFRYQRLCAGFVHATLWQFVIEVWAHVFQRLCTGFVHATHCSGCFNACARALFVQPPRCGYMQPVNSSSDACARALFVQQTEQFEHLCTGFVLATRNSKDHN